MGAFMIDRAALKLAAKQSMRGKKPSVYVVSAIYMTILGMVSVLTYALSGADRVAEEMMRRLYGGELLDYTDIASMVEPTPPIAGILILSLFIVGFLIDIGFMGYCLKICRDEEADIRTLFDGFSLFLKVIWLGILQYVFTLLWSLLFIVPGIMAAYSYRQAFYILLDNPEKSALECIRDSKRLMNGNRFDLFVLDISFLGWLLLDRFVEAYAIFRLFSTWLSPYMGITRAGFYLRLIEDAASAGAPGNSPS
jgi:uncharacterized membrane protein